MTVEVPASTVVVLGGARIGMPGQNLGIAQRHPGVQGVGDRGVPKGVWADVSGDPSDFRDPNHHAVAVW